MVDDESGEVLSGGGQNDDTAAISHSDDVNNFSSVESLKVSCMSMLMSVITKF